jgi:hypothetical protein
VATEKVLYNIRWPSGENELASAEGADNRGSPGLLPSAGAVKSRASGPLTARAGRCSFPNQ